jgi:hypothetical protein
VTPRLLRLSWNYKEAQPPTWRVCRRRPVCSCNPQRRRLSPCQRLSTGRAGWGCRPSLHEAVDCKSTPNTYWFHYSPRGKFRPVTLCGISKHSLYLTPLVTATRQVTDPWTASKLRLSDGGVFCGTQHGSRVFCAQTFLMSRWVLVFRKSLHSALAFVDDIIWKF